MRVARQFFRGLGRSLAVIGTVVVLVVMAFGGFVLAAGFNHWWALWYLPILLACIYKIGEK